MLAVASKKPGHGHFRQFIQDLKRCYEMVIVWETWNPVLEAKMPQYGFTRVLQAASGDLATGWVFVDGGITIPDDADMICCDPRHPILMGPDGKPREGLGKVAIFKQDDEQHHKACLLIAQSTEQFQWGCYRAGISDGLIHLKPA